MSRENKGVHIAPGIRHDLRVEIQGVAWGLAERQHGVIGRRQLHHLGFGEVQIRALAKRGALLPLSPEVFRLSGAPLTDLADAMSGVLDAPPGAVLSYESAAALWDVPGFDFRGAVHVTIPRQGVRSRSRVSILHFQSDLPLEETVLRKGIPVSSPTLLAFQLAASQNPAKAERAYDFLLSRHLTSGSRLDDLVRQIGGKGRNGTRVARELVRLSNGKPPPESGFERRVDWLAQQAGVAVRRQVSLGDSDFIGRVDFDLVGRRGVIEAQSLTYHSSPLSAASDRDRIERLIGMGRSVMTLWDYQAFHYRDHVIGQIQAFARRLDSSEEPFHFECPDP